jgi:hypothetical protein
MKVKADYILFAVLGVVVLYALSKLRQAEVQQVPEFIGSQVGGDGGAGSLAVRESSRLGAFQALASLGAAQIQSDTSKAQTGAQLEATRIAKDIQLGEQSTQERIQQLITGSAERIQSIVTGAAERTTGYTVDAQERIASQTLSTGFEQSRYAIDSQAALYREDLANRMATLKTQIEAVQNASYTYRNQSLERAGVNLNALGQIWGRGAAYSYDEAFSNRPGVLQQLFPNGLDGIAKSLIGLF